MNSEFLSRAETIFTAAAELPRAQRLDFVQQQCGTDTKLFNLVSKLLANDHQGMGSFLESSENSPQNILSASALEGTLFAQYRIVRRIGQGGMGQVFLAQQQKPQREVALKVLPTNLLNPSLARRFKLEIEVLGRLNNPGIAQIHDAGTTEDGFSYFAMEYVPGKPLSDFVKNHELGPRECLKLVVQICNAVQYANDQGVIHRDLKPANILVVDHGDGEYQTKVLDFGVARLTQDMGPDASLYTMPGQLLGTLAYMSPEQASGETQKMGPRSDVYQLGVILFELLTGQLPLDVDTESIPKTLGRIIEEEPPRLGTLNIALRGDLEIIVAKAMDKESDRRYSGAGEFAADLQRFLAGEPIIARSTTAFYRMGKVFKRRRSLILSTVTVAILVGFLAIFLVKSDPLPPKGAPKMTQLTDMQNKRFPGHSLALSPDGMTLAYVSEGHVVFRHMATGETTIQEALTEGRNYASCVSWFPTGNEILVEYIVVEGKRVLVRCPLESGDQEVVHTYSHNAYPAVSPDGKKVLLNIENGQAYSVLDLPTGTLKTVIRASDDESLGVPVWSPDSQYLANYRKREPDIFLECIDLAGNVTQLLSDPGLWIVPNRVTMAWLPSDQLLYCRLQDKAGTATEILSLPMNVSQGKFNGKPWRIHSMENRVITDLTYSPETNTLLFVANLRESKLVQFDLEETPHLVPHQLTSRGWVCSPLGWMPDGQRLLLRETTDTYKDKAMIRDMISGDCHIVDCFPDSAETIGLASDGRHLFYIQNLKIIAIPWDCGPIIDLGFTLHFKPQWIEVLGPLAGQGNSLLLVKEGNIIHVREISLDNGVGPKLTPIIPDVTGLTAQYWAWAHLSHDGKQLAICEYKSTIKLYDRSSEEIQIIPTNLDKVRQVRWSWDGRWIYFEGKAGTKNCLSRVNPTTGKSELLWSDNMDMLIFPELSPDGKSLVIDYLNMGTDLFKIEGL